MKWIELSESAFQHNIKSLVKLAGKRKIAVSVKANAYGHGLPQIVSMLIPLKAVEYITVHEIEEAIQARFAGWDRKILLLGPFFPDDTDAIFEYDIEPTIFD
ncbi:MAG: alanine racemase, partial [candidate division Zixibacteria bacterium]|nr:alanine racemase [candidate division Zixibacteria bacterium]